MKNKIVKASEKYNKPTPKKWRKIGDAILGLGTMLTTIAAVTGSNPILIVGSAVLTWAGKTLTNFASE